MGKLKLKQYQIKAKNFIVNNEKAILAVGMGLGKTAAALHAVAELNPKTLLIVAPKNVAENVWMQEALKWGLTDLYDKMVIVVGTPKKRAEKLSDKAKPYKIIGRDLLKDVQNTEYEVLIMDELTSFKNVETKRAEYISSIKAKRRIGLTGTFLTRGAVDTFGQAQAIYGNEPNPLGYNYDSWLHGHFQDVIPSKYKWSKWVILKKFTLDDILAPVKSVIFTLDSADWLEIPKVEYIDIKFDLSKKERANYDNMNLFLYSDLGVVYSEEQKMAKLATLACDFFYPKNRLSEPPRRGDVATKLTMVADLCERAVGEGEQILLFYAFIEEALWLSEMLKRRGIRFCSTRDKKFMDKWNNGDIDILITHPASAGHGLNLQYGGRIVVWSTFTSDYELWAQANARIIRQGQTKGAKVYRFIANKTKEENTAVNLSEKHAEFLSFINLTK